MPPNLLDILNRTAGFFAQAGLEKPRLEAEWLLAAVLDCKRLELYLQFDRPMTPDILDRLRPLVRRRAQREPLQYILGESDFFSLKLQVDRRVLIPRPETEGLVERIIERTAGKVPGRVLDLGTGSGAIALALAQAFPASTVVAVERSPDALVVARKNADRNGLADRVRFVEGTWFGPLEAEIFDLIVSNPPYLSREEWSDSQPEVREHEPFPALVAEESGRSDLEEILCRAPAHLSAGGLLALETGIAQHTLLSERAHAAGYAGWVSAEDDSGRDRYFFAWTDAG